MSLKPEVLLPSEFDQSIVSYIQQEASHGSDHAFKTADLTLPIAHEPEYEGMITEEDLICLRHAGLLHDVGYKETRPYWSGTQEEHPLESANIALDVLKDIEFYKQNPSQLGQVLWLIYNHDNTNYTFPAYWLFEQEYLERDPPDIAIPRLLPGTIRKLPQILERRLGNGNDSEVRLIDDKRVMLLQILQEADSRLGDAARTLEFCKKRGVHTFSNDGGVAGIGPLWWQESAAANIILALNRALLDAHTASGQEIARRIYKEGYSFVRALYEQELKERDIRPEYRTETIAQLRDDDIDNIFRRSVKEKWTNIGTDLTYLNYTKNLVGTFHEVSDRNNLRGLSVATRLIPTQDLTYAPKQLDVPLLEIRESLLKRYAMDIFTQLIGSADVEIIEHTLEVDETRSQFLCPPVIRTSSYGITSVLGRPPYRIFSGGNWVEAAKQIGLPAVRAIFIEGS